MEVLNQLQQPGNQQSQNRISNNVQQRQQQRTPSHTYQNYQHQENVKEGKLKLTSLLINLIPLFIMIRGINSKGE